MVLHVARQAVKEARIEHAGRTFYGYSACQLDPPQGTLAPKSFLWRTENDPGADENILRDAPRE